MKGNSIGLFYGFRMNRAGYYKSKSELYWFKLDNDYFNEASNALHKVTTSYMMLLLFETF